MLAVHTINKTARSGVTWLPKTPADEGLASGASEVRVGGLLVSQVRQILDLKKNSESTTVQKSKGHSKKRRGLTTLGHCERPTPVRERSEQGPSRWASQCPSVVRVSRWPNFYEIPGRLVVVIVGEEYSH
ncbi:hypothetical protein TYRP_014600 [Tyrophagus putrescentiae]|nr:hypothetical protein TYRP_014600 [Tyrophagus putrescentiae]